MLSYKDYPETELLRLVKEGSYSAFDELYNRHWNVLFGSAYNILRDKDACMDLVQDIFVWFWENRQNWVLSSCKGYLLTAVKFKTANYLRNSKNRESVIQQLAKVKSDYSEEGNLEAKQLEMLIKQITDQLPEKCKEIFQLSRYNFLSNKEIAVKLQISEKTVENQLTIALKRLRQKLSSGGNVALFFIL